MKQIKVRYEASSTATSQIFTLEDLGHDEESWAALSESEKTDLLMDAIVEQPYWSVDRIEEIDN